MMESPSLAEFVVDQIFTFREIATRRAPDFFGVPENVIAFRDFVQALPYVWVGQQNQNNQYLAGQKPANQKAL